VGMKNPEVQLLVYQKDISAYKVKIDYKGVTLLQSIRTQNPDYVFLDLRIDPNTAAGKIPIEFSMGKKSFVHHYELKKRLSQKGRIQGFDASDLMYLVMPDRFANGNPDNDTVEGMLEKGDRKAPYGRHGGDLEGIIDHLDYFKNMGITTLWINPVLENDMKDYSYHGYAITDFYQVDKRFGGNEVYQELIDKAHENGIKIVMDMVNNHIGTASFLIKNLPTPDFINQFDTGYTRSNFRIEAWSDPHASQHDLKKMSNGWFDKGMADFNQKNPFVQKYLIQANIWWVEESGIDGIRMDTYPYSDKEYMSKWTNALLDEYPQLNIVGECWSTTLGGGSYWQLKQNPDGYYSSLPSITDFHTYNGIRFALNEDFGWDKGWARLYYTLAQDFLHTNPNGNLIFLDNHDINRFYSEINEDFEKYKLGTAILLTMRGIPQWYYGTEILSTGFDNNHADLRKDFLGGWKDDKINAFTGEGLEKNQKEAQDFFKKIAVWRRSKGNFWKNAKLMHYLPENEVYVYFRYTDTETVMVVLNSSKKEATLDTKHLHERLNGFSKGTEIISGKIIDNLQKIQIPARSALLIDLSK